jgi:VanZ family protein
MRWYAAAAAFMAAIWWESSRTFDFPKGAPSFTDKILHATAWMILSALIAMGARRHRYGLLIAFVVAALYGAVDETHQSYVPGRDSSWGDLVADAAGAVLGATLATAYDRRRHGDRS